jgi:hypothetical protein
MLGFRLQIGSDQVCHTLERLFFPWVHTFTQLIIRRISRSFLCSHSLMFLSHVTLTSVGVTSRLVSRLLHTFLLGATQAWQHYTLKNVKMFLRLHYSTT